MTLLLIAVLYFAPSIIAHFRDRQFMAIFVLNACFGWLIVPWLIALIWALTDKPVERRA